MKTKKIALQTVPSRHRQPNIERVYEAVCVLSAIIPVVKLYIHNLPECYTELDRGKLTANIVFSYPVTEYVNEDCTVCRMEPFADVENRIIKAVAFLNENTITINATGAYPALLKTAVNRLNLTVDQVCTIEKMAIAIAAMGFYTEVRIEHLAEAIQYFSGHDYFNTWENIANTYKAKTGEAIPAEVVKFLFEEYREPYQR